jgi:hypothetical protein
MAELFGIIGAPGLIELMIFSGLILTGLICAINAFFIAFKLELERRRLQNWLGFSWLEPSLSVGCLVIAFNFFPNTRSHFEILLMVIPSLLFCLLILPTVWLSSRDASIQSIWQQLKRVVVARAFMVLFLLGSIMTERFFPQGFIVLEITAAINLAILIWSFYCLAQLATQPHVRELSSLSSRTIK